MTRAELLAELFNAAPVSIGVGGTSGQINRDGDDRLDFGSGGHDPTIMNGAVMKNYASGSRVGGGHVFVSEVDGKRWIDRALSADGRGAQQCRG